MKIDVPLPGTEYQEPYLRFQLVQIGYREAEIDGMTYFEAVQMMMFKRYDRHVEDLYTKRAMKKSG